MRNIFCSGTSIVVGALLAEVFGVSIVVGIAAGVMIGTVVSSLVSKSRAFGALAGGAISLIIVLIIALGLSRAVRCDFGDPADLPPLQHPAGYIYVIKDTDFSKFYKIGRTSDPSRRLNEFKVILPFETDVIAIIETEDAPTLEWQLHQRYAEQRRRGEWFSLSAAQVREICNI